MALVKGQRSLWPMLGLFALLLASLYLLSDATQNSAQFGRLYSWLLLVNSLALVLLTALIGSNLYTLVRQYRSGAAGSRLTMRLVVLFIVLAVVPVTIVYYFSIQFLQRGIDSWFDVQLEQALDDALALSRSALDQRMRERMRESQAIANELAEVPQGLLPLTLNDMRVRTEATEITLLGDNGQILAASSTDPSSSLVPHRPTDNILLQLREGRPYVGLDPIGDLGLHIRTVVRVPAATAAEGRRVLQILYPVAERLNALADGVQSGVARYKELVYLRGPLKQSFVLTLSLVLLLSLLAAVWSAFYSARRLVAPIRELAEGTQAVAEGHYDKQLAPAGKDELGFLVHSFNTMTRKLAAARDAASRSQRQAENQRAYLEVVLSRLSSGVLTLDRRGMLRTVNTAASQILGLELGDRIGHRFTELAEAYPHLQRFTDALRPHLEGGEGEWREEVVLFGTSGRQVLMCRGSTLPGHRGKAGGHVVVFDDITALIQAQRDAAWAEVARRLAHEIKNPLTPIQLSAERLRQKYLDGNDFSDTDVLDRATHTIVEQVKAMKGMVNAFSQYARPAELALERVDLNEIVNEVLDLYRGGEQGAELTFEAGTELPAVEADPGRLRQLLHNLVKNAIEAGGSDVRLALRTRAMHEHGWRFVELAIEDNGPGFSAEMLGQLFEPYVTTKLKGTGLGLAIVKKIVEEHGGTISADNAERGGARVVIRLPSAETQALPATPSVGGEHG